MTLYFQLGFHKDCFCMCVRQIQGQMGISLTWLELDFIVLLQYVVVYENQELVGQTLDFPCSVDLMINCVSNCVAIPVKY